MSYKPETSHNQRASRRFEAFDDEDIYFDDIRFGPMPTKRAQSKSSSLASSSPSPSPSPVPKSGTPFTEGPVGPHRPRPPPPRASSSPATSDSIGVARSKSHGVEKSYHSPPVNPRLPPRPISYSAGVGRGARSPRGQKDDIRLARGPQGRTAPSLSSSSDGNKNIRPRLMNVLTQRKVCSHSLPLVYSC